MTPKHIRQDGGYQACALLALGRSPLRGPDGTPKDVDRAIKTAFDGSWRKFKRWADYYLEEGMGICG